MAATKRVGILGSGHVAQQLGRGFAKHGYEVLLGSRDPSKLASWRKTIGTAASTGTFADAAAFGGIVVLATHGSGTEAAIDLAGPERFAGKLVLDATNPLDFSHGGSPGLYLGVTDSLGERVQRKLPQSKVVKCFNTMSNTRMVDPVFQGDPPPMMICGDDAEAKRTATAIIRELGWPGTIDVGGIDGARWLEAFVPLWMRVGQAINTFEHVAAFVR